MSRGRTRFCLHLASYGEAAAFDESRRRNEVFKAYELERTVKTTHFLSVSNVHLKNEVHPGELVRHQINAPKTNELESYCERACTIQKSES